MKLQHIKISDLDTNTVQPKARTNPKQLDRLAEVLKLRGLRKPIAVVRVARAKLVVVDGHRTMAAWQSLGNTSILCSVSDVATDVEAQALFAEMNSGTKAMASRAYLEQWANATDGEAQLKAMGRMGYKIRYFIKVFGEKDARAYGKRGDVDPTAAGRAVMCARTMALYRSIQPQPAPAKIGHWMIKHRAMVTVLFVCRYGTDRQVKALAAAVNSDKYYDVKRTVRRDGTKRVA